jgi:hypothetical protein
MSGGLWITGPSRSGTSMTAGLFAAHGVFFGDCGNGDRFNPKGYWEHPELVSRVETKVRAGWPYAFWATLRGEGWDGEGVWGVKRGPNAWPWVRELEPSVILMTHRPRREIQASRIRWGRAKNTGKALAKAEAALHRIEQAAECPVVHVQTDELVAGKYGSVLNVVSLLGLTFDPAVANEWVDPALWNRGLKS